MSETLRERQTITILNTDNEYCADKGISRSKFFRQAVAASRSGKFQYLHNNPIKRADDAVKRVSISLLPEDYVYCLDHGIKRSSFFRQALEAHREGQLEYKHNDRKKDEQTRTVGNDCPAA